MKEVLEHLTEDLAFETEQRPTISNCKALVAIALVTRWRPVGPVLALFARLSNWAVLVLT